MRLRPNWEAGGGEKRRNRIKESLDVVDERERFDGRALMMLSGYLGAAGSWLENRGRCSS